MSNLTPTQYERTQEVSDALLVQQAQHDPAQFAVLFERYWDAIFRFCYYRLGDWHAAEDAAGQVFLNAIGALPGFRDPGHDNAFRGWLFTIAHHVVSNSRRFAVRHLAHSIEIAAGHQHPGASVEETAIAFDEQRQVHALISQLKPEQRQMMELRLAGLTDVEIARVLDRSPAAVRKAQSRAVFTLRGLLGIQVAPSSVQNEASDD